MSTLIKSHINRWSNVLFVTSGKETAVETRNGAKKIRLEKQDRLMSRSLIALYLVWATAWWAQTVRDRFLLVQIDPDGSLTAPPPPIWFCTGSFF